MLQKNCRGFFWKFKIPISVFFQYFNNSKNLKNFDSGEQECLKFYSCLIVVLNFWYEQNGWDVSKEYDIMKFNRFDACNILLIIII